MNDLQAINEIVENSVRSSSYISVIISSIVFILYTLIIQIVNFFKSKSKNKPLVEMAIALKENTENIVKLNAVLDKTLRDAERKELNKCKNVIDLSFTTFKSRISQECEDIIAHNNINKNKDYIINNIKSIVSTEYYKLYSVLSAYEINNINVSTKLKDDWIVEVSDSILDIVYNGQKELTRIVQINNKLLILIGNYITYMNNKTFNT